MPVSGVRLATASRVQLCPSGERETVSRTVEVGKAREQPVGAPRRTRVVVKRVGPWSVLKFSLLFYGCVMLIGLLALGILYWILAAAGILESMGKLFGALGLGGTCTEVEGGPTRECVLQFQGGWLFTRLFFVGIVLVVAWSLVNMLVALLYNLVSDVIGGVDMTLVERRQD